MFRDSKFFLSNFYLVQVVYEGITYPTSEHAFVAAKTTDRNIKLQVANIAKPGQAKRFGKTIELRHDWDTYRLQAMYDILLIKFANPRLRQMLLNTGSEELVEVNTWGDKYWGVYNGDGHNHLGKILMKIRQELGGQGGGLNATSVQAAPKPQRKTTMKAFAAIGSRLQFLSETARAAIPIISELLRQSDVYMRTGAALGADQLWANYYTHERVLLYLPWGPYEADWVQSSSFIVASHEPDGEAIEYALQYHVAPNALKQGAQKMIGRNAQIIMGRDLSTPVEFVLATSRSNGKFGGGTMHGVDIARANGIPVYDVCNANDRVQFLIDMGLDGKRGILPFEDDMPSEPQAQPKVIEFAEIPDSF